MAKAAFFQFYKDGEPIGVRFYRTNNDRYAWDIQGQPGPTEIGNPYWALAGFLNFYYTVKRKCETTPIDWGDYAQLYREYTGRPAKYRNYICADCGTEVNANMIPDICRSDGLCLECYRRLFRLTRGAKDGQI